MYASVLCIRIGSSYGLSPDRRQAIIWFRAGLFSVGLSPGNKIQWNLNRNSIIFIQVNAFENVVFQNGAQNGG